MGSHHPGLSRSLGHLAKMELHPDLGNVDAEDHDAWGLEMLDGHP